METCATTQDVDRRVRVQNSESSFDCVQYSGNDGERDTEQKATLTENMLYSYIE